MHTSIIIHAIQEPQTIDNIIMWYSVRLFVFYYCECVYLKKKKIKR